MKNCLSLRCCEYPYNIVSFFCSKMNSIFNKLNPQIIQTKDFSQIPSNIETAEENSEINNPAKILSSEEINEIIKDQIKYSKEQTNSNGYKIIKQKNPYDSVKSGELMNMEEIKKEINQIEFEEEEQKQNIENNNVNNGIENNEEVLDNNEEEENNLNIEELRKEFLGNQPFLTRSVCSLSSLMHHNKTHAKMPKIPEIISSSINKDNAPQINPAIKNSGQILYPK